MSREWRKISDCFWFQEGPGVRKHQYRDSGVKLLNVANLVGGKVDISNTSRFISEEEAYGKYKHFLVDDGDFIVASSGIKVEYFNEKMGFVSADDLPLCMNTSTIRFKPLNPAEDDLRYLMYYLKSDSFKRQLARQITGSAQLNFGPSHLKRMSFLHHEISKQREIVKNLDRVSETIEMHRAVIEKLNHLVKSRFVEMFGDPVTNSGDWSTEELRMNIELVNGRAYKQAELLESGKYRVLRVGNFFTNSSWYYSDMELNPDKYCDNGDLLYAWSASFGPRIWDGEKVIYHYHIWKIKFLTRAYSKLFLKHLLDYAAPSFIGDAHGIGMVHLTKQGMESTPFIVPSIELQKEFERFAIQIDKSQFAVRQSIEQLELLKAKLMQEYFG